MGSGFLQLQYRIIKIHELGMWVNKRFLLVGRCQVVAANRCGVLHVANPGAGGKWNLFEQVFEQVLVPLVISDVSKKDFMSLATASREWPTWVSGTIMIPVRRPRILGSIPSVVLCCVIRSH